MTDTGMLRDLLGADVLEHVKHLEENFLVPRAFDRRVESSSLGSSDYDVLQVGGGPAIIHAILLAHKGVRVAVADRRRVGCAHREWNISRPELLPLVQRGILDENQLREVIVASYDHGIVQWHGGERRKVHGVLDQAVDAQALMALLRRRAEDVGVTLLEHHAWNGLAVHPDGVLATFGTAQGTVEVKARVLLDGTGSSSPMADFDLCCPTVGGVYSGLAEGDAPDEVDMRVGEILVSTEGAIDGRQHIWEGFPGRHGEYTVYLFHYAEPVRLEKDSLTALYGRFVETLPTYKRGQGKLLRPTYGIIPAHSRLRPVTVAPMDRVLRVGDAAARQSPLTFCGFGSLVRSFGPVVDALVSALEADRVDRESLEKTWTDPEQLPLMGALALMMMDRGAFRKDPGGINRLLDAAFGTLADMGEDVFGRFVRDQATRKEVVKFAWEVSRRHPAVFGAVMRNLGTGELFRWAGMAAVAAAA